MNRPRKTDKHLPQCVYLKHGSYWLVKAGKWSKLGADLAAALAEYARRMDGNSAGDCLKPIEPCSQIVAR